jgi:hypothetical protein
MQSQRRLIAIADQLESLMKRNRPGPLTGLPAQLLASAALALALPGAALAACPKWDVNGPLDMIQTNGSVVNATLHQTATGIQGDARYTVKRDDGAFNGYNYYDVGGSLDGTIDGDSFDLTIYWTNQTTGVYTGRISPQGRITGSTYDAQHPQTIANWYSGRTLTCLAAPVAASAPAAAAPAKTGKTLGRTPAPPGSAPKPPMSVCDRARDARARNSPAAPALAEACVASGGK